VSSAIEWTDETWNPTTGCDRVGPGCDNCYALTMAARLKAMGQAKYRNDGDPRTSGPGFGSPSRPTRSACRCGGARPAACSSTRCRTCSTAMSR
jgi:protein gp37